MPLTVSKIKSIVLDTLLPKRCIGCGKEGLYICNNCEVFMTEIEFHPGDVMSVWQYNGVLEKAIGKIKRDGCYDIVNELVDKFFKKMEVNLPWDMHIAYVPMSEEEERRKGFNQSKLIAESIAKRLNRRVLPLLSKNGNVFLYNHDFVPSQVMVVDDVYLTGSTFKECRKILLEAGVKNIIGFTLARQA